MYCRKCGTWCEDQAVFCSQCGESLAGNDKQNPGTMYNTNNSYGTNSYNMNYQGGYGIMVTYAGFWKRVLAIIIDGLILGIVEGIINWIFTSVGLETVGSILSIIIAWLYYSLMESSEYQATLGKMALHLRVTDVTGNRVSFARATGRYFGKIISGIILCIGYMMAGWTEKKQALHDIMAGTLVVSEQ